MKWFWLTLVILVGLIVLVVTIGALLPKEHVSTRAARLHQPPAITWAAITDLDAFPSWRPGLKSVERLPDHNGLVAWREVDNHGQAIPFEVVESAPPQRLVVRIADPKLPFGGTWTYEIRAVGGRELRITEHGEVYNPVFRFMSRFVFDNHSAMDAYLRALGQKFGEKVTLED